MIDDPTLPEPPDAPGGSLTPELPEQEVRDELQRIVTSREFKSSKRCVQFLEYVVDQALAGLPNGLKERTIGVDVFGRAVTYDTNVEGIVRIKASEVRKRLALYYAGTGRESRIRIELPVGTYVPAFSRLGPEPEESGPLPALPAAPPSSLPSSLPPSPSPSSGDPSPGQEPPGRPSPVARSRRGLWIGAALLLVTALVLGAGLWRKSRSRTAFEDFWAPVLDPKRPVLVAAAYAPVYLSGTDEPTSLKDLSLLKDQYVGGGDLVAAAQMTGMLARLRQPYEVRVGQGVTFEDLRGGGSILIGYSSTHWSEMTKDLRYYIDDSQESMIYDNGKPTAWYPKLTAEYHTDNDYAIVARAILPHTHAPMVLVTGCTQYGTEAAGILVSNPELLAEALKDAPKGWQHMNLELVLQLKVIANAPGTPKVIASHYW